LLSGSLCFDEPTHEHNLLQQHGNSMLFYTRNILSVFEFLVVVSNFCLEWFLFGGGGGGVVLE
jgi:hypothetical protein